VKWTLALSAHSRASVWLDDHPPAAFTATATVERLVIPRTVVRASHRRAGVELNVVHGPKCSYAALGGELEDTGSEGLLAIVHVNRRGFPFRPSLAIAPDEAKVGLLAEYAEGVLSGVERVAQVEGAPTCATLHFRWAAHAAVGSSSSSFERVSAIVVRLLTSPIATEDDVRALFA